MEKLTRKILNLPPVRIKAAVDKLKTNERYDIMKDLESLAATSAWFAGYVGHRYGHGCGDQGHDSAIKEANKARRKTRKAFGYHDTRDIIT